jgi:hypothetical protein
MFIVFIPINIIVHELGHYLAGTLIYKVHCDISINNPIGLNLSDPIGMCSCYGQIGKIANYAGGFLIVIFLLCVFFIFRKKLTIDIKIYLCIFIVVNLVYGLYEGITG